MCLSLNDYVCLCGMTSVPLRASSVRPCFSRAVTKRHRLCNIQRRIYPPSWSSLASCLHLPKQPFFPPRYASLPPLQNWFPPSSSNSDLCPFPQLPACPAPLNAACTLSSIGMTDGPQRYAVRSRSEKGMMCQRELCRVGQVSKKHTAKGQKSGSNRVVRSCRT